jgi:hypothetical protein
MLPILIIAELSGDDLILCPITTLICLAKYIKTYIMVMCP